MKMTARKTRRFRKRGGKSIKRKHSTRKYSTRKHSTRKYSTTKDITTTRADALIGFGKY